MKSTRAASSRQPALAVVASAEPSARASRVLRIAIVGTGHVGLVTAACLASFGHEVVAIDVDPLHLDRLDRLDHLDHLTEGDLTPHEAGLPTLVREQREAGRLRFTADAEQALHGLDLVFVAVGTPARADGAAELRAIDDVAHRLAAQVRAPTVVVLKSSVPVGTARRLEAMFEAAAAADGQGAPARVLNNPEFLREGCAVEDFLAPTRLLIGDDAPDGPARRTLLAAYAPLVAAGVQVLTMDTRSAELSKQAANAMLATRISFINEIAGIAAATGADIEHVREGLGSDTRIGPAFLHAGLGYGGSCLPKDVAALRETARQHNVRSDMLLATERINSRQRCWAFDAMQRDIGSRRQMRSLKVALWGLAFKPGTDDVREAPSLALIDRLTRAGACVTVYDPAAAGNARLVIGGNRRVAWAESANAALQGADVLVLATEWPEFAAFEPALAARALALRLVYDGRNELDAPAWAAAGLKVVQVGRASTLPPASLAAMGAPSLNAPSLSTAPASLSASLSAALLPALSTPSPNGSALPTAKARDADRHAARPFTPAAGLGAGGR